MEVLAKSQSAMMTAFNLKNCFNIATDFILNSDNFFLAFNPVKVEVLRFSRNLNN